MRNNHSRPQKNISLAQSQQLLRTLFKEINNKLGNGNGNETKQKELDLDDIVQDEVQSEDPASEELDDCPDPPNINEHNLGEKKSSGA